MNREKAEPLAAHGFFGFLGWRFTPSYGKWWPVGPYSHGPYQLRIFGGWFHVIFLFRYTDFWWLAVPFVFLAVSHPIVYWNYAADIFEQWNISGCIFSSWWLQPPPSKKIGHHTTQIYMGHFLHTTRIQGSHTDQPVHMVVFHVDSPGWNGQKNTP